MMKGINFDKSAMVIISTPLHVIYAIEFIYKENIANIDILVLLKRSTDKQQISEILKEYKWRNIHWIELTSYPANLFISIYEFIYSYRIPYKLNEYDYGIYADYGKSIIANISCNDYVWLGDGSKIIYETSIKHNKKFNRHKKHIFLNRVVMLLTGKLLALPKKPKLFTPFFLDYEDCEINEFSWLKEKYISKYNSMNIDDNVVYFFGTYFSERNGTPLMEDDSYLHYMREINIFFKKRGKKIIYISHRHESHAKLASINSMSDNITVSNINYPAEYYFYKNNILPVNIASFFSTCLLNFKMLNICKSITSFYINFSNHNDNYKDTAESIYDYIEFALGQNNLILLDSR